VAQLSKEEILMLQQSINKIKGVIIELVHQKSEIEVRIEDLEVIKMALTRLLPTDERLAQLFP
jgi:hypothetical protein